MKLESLVAAADSVTLFFHENAHDVQKRFRSNGLSPQELRHLVLLKIREARRDFLYFLHGDDWRQHDKGKFFSATETPEEEEIVNEAIRLLNGDPNP